VSDPRSRDAFVDNNLDHPLWLVIVGMRFGLYDGHGSLPGCAVEVSPDNVGNRVYTRLNLALPSDYSGDLATDGKRAGMIDIDCRRENQRRFPKTTLVVPSNCAFCQRTARIVATPQHEPFFLLVARGYSSELSMVGLSIRPSPSSSQTAPPFLGGRATLLGYFSISAPPFSRAGWSVASRGSDWEAKLEKIKGQYGQSPDSYPAFKIALLQRDKLVCVYGLAYDRLSISDHLAALGLERLHIP